MSQKIKLVSGDTRPTLVMSVTDGNSGGVIDLSTATQILMKIRALGDTNVIAIPCTKLFGRLNADGSITTTPPFDVAGAGGRISMDWTPAALANPGELEGELEITFADGSVQTVYSVLKFSVRAQF